MTDPITMHPDPHTGIHLVAMLGPITTADLEAWGRDLAQLAAGSGPAGLTLLIDTGEHRFTSIAALRLLRTLLTTGPIAPNLARVAFVAPREYQPARVASAREAYFNDLDEAHRWLLV